MQSTIPYLHTKTGLQHISRQSLVWLESVWMLVVAVPILLPGLLSLRGQVAIVCSLLLLWPIRWILYRHKSDQWQIVQLALITLLFWLPINLWIAIDQISAWTSGGYLIFGITLYRVTCNHPWLHARPIYLGRLILLMGVFLMILAPALVQWKSEFRLFYTPIYDWFQMIPLDFGETIHANILGGALLSLTLIALALALPPIQKKIRYIEGGSDRIRYSPIKYHRAVAIQRLSAIVISVGLLILLVLTQSRGAYLGIGAGLLALSIIRWPRLLWVMPFLILGVSLATYQLGIWSIFELFGADNTFGGADWRTEVWHAAGQAFHDFPYTGIGIGNFRTVLPLLYPHPVIESDSATHAHNLIMQIGLDLGLPGVMAYLFFIIGTLGIGVRTLRIREHSAETQVQLAVETSRQYRRRLIHQARRHNENWALTAGAVAALVGIQVHGLLDAVTWGTKLAFLPWLIYAIIGLTSVQTSPEQVPSE